jgi:S-adenosylmethionine hydrolase
MTRPIVSLLTDFGVRDVSASICRAVVLGICPDAEVIDLTHEVRKYAIRDGALALWCALPYLPIGVHVAVVDPGVGTARRPLAIRAGRGDVLVGPDNGLLVPAAGRLGGIDAVRELANADYRLPVVASTFHGRDIFAPAAAHLARGAAFETLGPAIEPGSLVPSPLPVARVVDGVVETEVVYEDTFGNVKLSALAADVRDAFGEPAGRRFEVRVEAGPPLDLRWGRTFGELGPGDPLLYEDSYGRACIAINQGSAVAALGVRDGHRLEIRPR